MVGLLLKTMLTSKNLDTFWDKFKFLTKPEIVHVLEYGAELWMILKKIHMTACNRSQND